MMMQNGNLQSLLTFGVTIALIGFAYVMRAYENADTLSTVIITAVVTKWLQQGAQRASDRQHGDTTESSSSESTETFPK